MPISVLFVQSEPPPKVLLRSISISIFSQWHSVEAPLGFQADSDSPTLCNWLSSWYLEAPTASTALYSSLSSTLHCLHCSCSVSWDRTTLLLLRVPVMGLVELHSCCAWWITQPTLLCGPNILLPYNYHAPCVLYKETHCSRLKCLVYFRILLCWCIIVSL